MIVTVARDEGLRLRVAAALRDSPWGTPVTALSSVGEVEELLHSSAPPSAFVVGTDIGLAGAIDLVAATSGLRTSAPVFLVAEPTTDVLRGAMRAGVRDVLPPGFEPGDLVRAFEEARVRTSGPPPKPGLTVAVFSTKGGVGTSVVASNLAVCLGRQTGGAVALLDLDLASADQSIMHGLSPRWTVQDVADGTVGLDAESLSQALAPIPATSVRLLPGPVDPALAETITAANVGSIVAACRAETPVAVLDTSSGFDDRTLAALDAADAIVVVSSLDVAALRALTVSLQTLTRLGVGEDQIEIVVVRSDSKSGLTLGDVSRAIGRPVDIGVPSMRAVPRSVNEGTPMAVSAHRSGVTKAISDLAQRVLRHAPSDFEAQPNDSSGDGFLGGILPWSKSDEQAGSGASAPADDGSPVAPPASNPDDSGPAGDAGDQSGSGAETSADVVRLGERPRARVRRPPSQAASGEADDVTPLDALPPPVVSNDGNEDDQPRRRRRR